jgi:hypothetical protein
METRVRSGRLELTWLCHRSMCCMLKMSHRYLKIALTCQNDGAIRAMRRAGAVTSAGAFGVYEQRMMDTYVYNLQTERIEEVLRRKVVQV